MKLYSPASTRSGSFAITLLLGDLVALLIVLTGLGLIGFGLLTPIGVLDLVSNINDINWAWVIIFVGFLLCSGGFLIYVAVDYFKRGRT